MPKRVEVVDGESGLEALELAEKGPVSFSSDSTFIRETDDYELIADRIAHCVERSQTCVVESVRPTKAVMAAIHPPTPRIVPFINVHGIDSAVRALEMAEKHPVKITVRSGAIRYMRDPEAVTFLLGACIRAGVSCRVEKTTVDDKKFFESEKVLEQRGRFRCYNCQVDYPAGNLGGKISNKKLCYSCYAQLEPRVVNIIIGFDQKHGTLTSE